MRMFAVLLILIINVLGVKAQTLSGICINSHGDPIEYVTVGGSFYFRDMATGMEYSEGFGLGFQVKGSVIELKNE